MDKVAAVYMLDEPYLGPWHSLDAAQVQTQADQIHAAFPNKMINYTTDLPHLTSPVPRGVDLVGFDHYCPGRAAIKRNLAALERVLASPDQHMVLFPESINVPGLISGCEHVRDATIAANNAGYRAIAAQDPRVVYLLNFRWLNARQSTTMPRTTKMQKTLGKAVINAAGQARSRSVFQ
jgi:hypothetical protein